MSLLFSMTSVALVFTLGASPNDPCDAPRLRDTGALSMAVTQDKQVAAAFQKASAACGTDTEQCDQSRLECSTLLTATLKNQVGFDEGAWLRDMVLPYLGQNYVMSKPYAASSPPADVACTSEPAQLTAAANRRLSQAAKRQQLFEEYPKFSTWAQSMYTKCRDQAAVDQQKAAVARTDAAALAAAALAAKTAEELRQKNEDDAKKKAALAAAEVAAAKKAEQAAIAAQEKQERDAAKKAKQAEDDRVVAEREGRYAEVKAQKRQIVTDAEADLQKATNSANAKRKAAMAALDERNPAAPALAAEASSAEKARADSEQRLAEAKLRADQIELDVSAQRSRGSLGVQGVIGYGSLSSAEGQTAGVLIGAQGFAHFGFWGTAPAAGLASGLEVKLNAKFQTQAGGPGGQREFDGRGTVRWFFGRFGVGAAAEYRSFDSTLGTAARSFSGFGLGPSAGFAFVDNLNLRVMFNLTWLPIITNDLLRLVADLEVSWRFLTFGIAAGTSTDPQPIARLGFHLTGLAGVRFGW